MEIPPTTKSISVDLSKEQLMEKIAILQSKLKEVLAKKNALVSALSIEKIHSRHFEDANSRLLQENEYLKGLLGDKLPKTLTNFSNGKGSFELKNTE